MLVLLLIALFVLVGLLAAFDAFALIVSLLGVGTGERFARCPHCHHFGFTEHGVMHAHGCARHAPQPH